MLSTEYKTLFKNDPNVAFLAEDLSNFAETELKEDSLISVIKRVLNALCDGEYLASVMGAEETEEQEQEHIKTVETVFTLFELAYNIVKKMNGEKVDKLTEMVRCGDMPFPCLLDAIYRLHHLCEQNHKIIQKVLKITCN